LYPFYGRLVLFLAPGVPLVLARGLEGMRRWMHPWALGLVGLVMLASPVWTACHFAVMPRSRCELRPLLEYVRTNCQRGDLVYLCWHTGFHYQYYEYLSGGVAAEVIREVPAAQLVERLEQPPAVRRVWAVHSAVVDWNAPDPELLSVLNEEISQTLHRRGEYLGARRDRAAAVELFAVDVPAE
jgi:hypothetical protein